MYADTVTGSMERAIKETERRRGIQDAYNKAHGITPKTIIKDIAAPISVTAAVDISESERGGKEKLTPEKKRKIIEKLTADMKRAAKELDFETAAVLRDRIRRLM